MITYQTIKNNEEINTYIRMADETMLSMGFTEHSFSHVTKVAEQAYRLLKDLGYEDRTCELARIAGYMHDIGNVINRVDHAQSGAVMAFRILDKLGMSAAETATIITAIGNHDEDTAVPVNAIAAALILADKSDVRSSRVRRADMKSLADIHNRVNHAVKDSALQLDAEGSNVTLILTIDTEQCAVMDYFEIFMKRMLLCKRAANYLKLNFHLQVNGSDLL